MPMCLKFRENSLCFNEQNEDEDLNKVIRTGLLFGNSLSPFSCNFRRLHQINKLDRIDEVIKKEYLYLRE